MLTKSIAVMLALVSMIAGVVTHTIDWLFELATTFVHDPSEAWRKVRRDVRPAQALADDAGYRTVFAAQMTDRVLQFAVVGIVILLSILIYSEIDGSLPSPSNTDLSNASSNATVTFGDAMELAPIIILVGVAGLILVVVRNFTR